MNAGQMNAGQVNAGQANAHPMSAGQIAARLTAEQANRLRSHALWRECHPVTWPETLLDPGCTAAVWPLMAEEAALALELIAAAFGASPFTEEQLLQAARPGIAGAVLRLGLHRLGEAGIVFTVRRGWGEKLFVLPLDSLLPWHEAIRTARRGSDRRQQGLPPVEIDPRGIDAVEGDGYAPPFSLQLLHAMAHMADAGLKLTAKRVLTKKTIARGAGQLFVEDAALSALIQSPDASAGPNGMADAVYPPALLFVLETAFASGWLREANGSLVRDDAAWQGWLHASPAEREASLLRQVLAAACARHAAAAAGAAALCSLAPGVWYRAAEVEAAAAACRRLLAKPRPSMIDDWCRLFIQMGWLERGVDGTGSTVIRWLIEPAPFRRQAESPAGGDSGRFARSGVQLTPDGDLYVDEHCAYAVRWQLETAAERRRTDITTVYRIRPDSCKRAARAGHTRESLTAFLEELTQERLPDTVRAMIVLGMEGRSGENGGTRRDETSEAAAVPTCANTLFAQAEDGLYELIQERTTPRQLFAGIDDVPSMWLKQFRAYHLSTRRELMEQALRWRTAVKLNCAGAVTHFIPERIIDEDGGWAVSGYSRLRYDDDRHRFREEQLTQVKLYPAMWDEMMLLLPMPFGG